MRMLINAGNLFGAPNCLHAKPAYLLMGLWISLEAIDWVGGKVWFTEAVFVPLQQTHKNGAVRWMQFQLLLMMPLLRFFLGCSLLKVLARFFCCGFASRYNMEWKVPAWKKSEACQPCDGTQNLSIHIHTMCAMEPGCIFWRNRTCHVVNWRNRHPATGAKIGWPLSNSNLPPCP